MKWFFSSPGAAHYWVLTAVLLAVAILLRPVLVQSMTLHMLVHIPVLLTCGVMAAKAISLQLSQLIKGHQFNGMARQGASFNLYGAPGLLYASLTGMYWMIPKALDGVLLSPWAEAGKVLTVVLAGIVLFDSWRRADRVIKLFFVGGFCWTSAIAGLLYQESSERLCNFYLLSDQTWAGRGLVILAVTIPVLWLLAELRPREVKEFATKAATTPFQE